MATKNNTDLIIILGKQLSKEGVMPTDLKKRLNVVVEYLKSSPDTHILVSGKYGVEYDVQGFTPTHFECNEMYDYLVSKGIAANIISKECKSKDTISNVQYAKQYLTKHPKYQNIIVVCASHHKPRVKLLFDKYLDSTYQIDYLTVDVDYTQADLAFEEQKRNLIKL